MKKLSGMPAYSNAHTKVRFFMFGSNEIGSGLVSFEMIFEALESELYSLDFHSLCSKIPEFNLRM